jgi:transcriptional regulator with XRE-family HTH domain
MSPPDAPRPNNRLRQERIRRNLSQLDVANELNISEITVNRWERGIQRPGPNARRELCKLFGKSAEELGLLPDAPDLQTPTETKVSPPVDISSLPPDSLDHHPDANAPPAENSSLPIRNVSSPLPRAPKPSTRTTTQQDQSRTNMLLSLRLTYGNLLEHSLHGMVRLELGLARLPDAVQNATNLLLRVAGHPEQSLPPGTSLLLAYEEAAHELLILGAPGSGKSTLLLELALQLIDRAEQEETCPVPVILPLSSWAQNRPPFEGWLIKQLCQIYNFPEKLVRLWIEKERFALLLDGLDEMDEAARPFCIAAINDYHHAHLVPIVICSRRDEYEHAASRERLYLQSALLVQPLSQEQVQEYMHSMGEHVEALSAALQHDADLRTLSTTPLMLSILTLAYHDQPVEDLLRDSTPASRLHLIFSHYVSRMFSRPFLSDRFSSDHATRWLAALAHQLRSHHQTVFYLEHLHPDWLPPALYPPFRWLALLLPALLLGLFTSLLISFFFLQGSPDLPSLLHVSLLGALFGFLFSPSHIASVSPSLLPPPAPTSTPRLRFLPLFAGLGIGLFYVGCSALVQDATSWHPGSWLVGACMALVWALLLTCFSPSRWPASQQPPARWTALSWLLTPRIWQFSLLLGLGFGLANALCFWFSSGHFSGLTSGFGLSVISVPNQPLASGLLLGLCSCLGYALCCALLSSLIVGVLSVPLASMYLTEQVRWTWHSLRLSLFSPSHLRTTACFTALLGALSGLLAGLQVAQLDDFWTACSNALNFGLCFGLSLGLCYWLVLGLFQGVAQERLLDQDRLIINEGIRRSARNGLLLGLLGGGLIGLLGLLSDWLSIGLNDWLSSGQPDTWSDLFQSLLALLPVGLQIAFLAACFLALLSGGLTLWRHYLLRWQLARARLFPWLAPAFLTEMADRLLLRRVGGGYGFVHRLLLDYFADLDTADPAASPTSPGS